MALFVGHPELSEQVSAPAKQIVGIDFGTSCSAVARLDADGIPRLLPDGSGQELIDSVLSFGSDGSVRVGSLATADYAEGPVVTAVKRHLGERDFSVRFGGQRLTSEMLSALILRKLAGDAGRYGELSGVILTVPSYFYAPGRNATRTAGRIAGLPIVELLAEPVAAALACLWQTNGLQKDCGKSLLVFDLGGGTFDVTIVRVEGGRLLVTATEGDNNLGGIDWTNRLVGFAAEKFLRRHGSDPRKCPESLLRLTAVCEQAKCELSTKPRAVIEVDHAGITMPLGLCRDEFEQITADLMERAKDITEFLFESSGIEPDELDEIVLVGGGTKMPGVEEMMSRLCGRPVTTLAEPQRAVAEGAAVYAAAVAMRNGAAMPDRELRERLEAICLRDVNAHSIGIALDDPRGKRFSRNHILIPRNTPLPKTVQRRFVTSLANPEGIALRLVEGEAPEVSSCTAIGDWRILGLPPDLPAGSPVQVTFRCDHQREMSIEAKELTRQTVARVERVVRDGEVTEEAERVLAEFRLV